MCFILFMPQRFANGSSFLFLNALICALINALINALISTDLIFLLLVFLQYVYIPNSCKQSFPRQRLFFSLS